MKQNIFKTDFFSAEKRKNRTGTVLCCFLLILGLFVGGCSAPEKNTASSEPSAPEVSEETDSSATESEDSSPENSDSETSASEDSGSSEEDFDFSQTFDLKVPDPAAGENPRILFAGNSHTFTNNLPDMFKEVVIGMGRQCEVQELSEGYYTLTQFADTSDELGAALNQKLTDENWDFVILQENTNDAFSYAEENMLPAAAALDEKIRAAGGQTALLMTWTPKDGAGIMSPELVQSVLAENTMAVAENLNSLLIPGGIGFMRSLEQYPQIELWAEDGMHSSPAGSYLAACTAYAVIFQESPAGCSYTADLDSETAAQLQELAAGFLTN